MLTQETFLPTLTTHRPTEDPKNDSTNISKKEKWEEDNNWAKALILPCMLDDHVIPLFEQFEMGKEIVYALENKYIWSKVRVGENDSVGAHVQQIKLIAKELLDAGHPLIAETACTFS